MFVLYLAAIAGHIAYNDDQAAHGQASLSYVTGADFWEATLQNWQSDFLAVGSFAVLAIYLRQRGSPESKRVGARLDAQD
jgi:hypothetical protein